jgi:hypothetical protein
VVPTACRGDTRRLEWACAPDCAPGSITNQGIEHVGLKSLFRRPLEKFLPRFGYHLVPDGLIYDWQKPPPPSARIVSGTLPEEASAYLRGDNPRLRELQAAYSRFAGPTTVPSVWSPGYVRPEDLLYFRADGPYVWQVRRHDMNELSYALTYYYTKATDRLDLLSRLHEDKMFGVHTHKVGNQLVSRDLLDSINEINFLDRHLQISHNNGAVLLDIGAGYGRLAYRTLQGLPCISQYLCTDAIATSTFLCEYYLQYREVNHRARVIPLHEIEARLREQKVDLAVNIHSFSECRVEAIEWWASLLQEHRVRNVMIVPNHVTPDGGTMLTNSGADFSRVFYDRGYQLVARENKYTDALAQKYAISPSIYFLFAAK